MTPEERFFGMLFLSTKDRANRESKKPSYTTKFRRAEKVFHISILRAVFHPFRTQNDPAKKRLQIEKGIRTLPPENLRADQSKCALRPGETRYETKHGCGRTSHGSRHDSRRRPVFQTNAAALKAAARIQSQTMALVTATGWSAPAEASRRA